MSTPVSGAAAYCTVAQFLQSYDVRTVGQLLSDTNVAYTVTDINNIGSTANLTLLALLQKASGMLESACLLGNRYAPADLSGLTGNSAQFLAGLVADLAMWLLWNRRPDRKTPIPAQASVALDWLESLRTGDRIFGTQEAMNAGEPEDVQEKVSDVQNRYGAVVIGRRFWGNRGNMLTPPPTQ